MTDLRPEDPDYFIDERDQPLPPGTPVNCRGLPILVMSDPDDLEWPRPRLRPSHRARPEPPDEPEVA